MRNWTLVNTTSILISELLHFPNSTEINGEREGAPLQATQGLFWEPLAGAQGSPAALPGRTSALWPRSCSALPRMCLSHSTSGLSHISVNLARSHLFTPAGPTRWLPWGCWSLKSPIIDLL